MYSTDLSNIEPTPVATGKADRQLEKIVEGVIRSYYDEFDGPAIFIRKEGVAGQQHDGVFLHKSYVQDMLDIHLKFKMTKALEDLVARQNQVIHNLQQELKHMQRNGKGSFPTNRK